MKLLQLNIEQGRFLDDVVSYIKKHDFDIVHLQEVGSGVLSKSGSDNFAVIEEQTGLSGIRAPLYGKRDEHHSTFSNATLFKPFIKKLSHSIIYMKEFVEIEASEKMDHQYAPRNALHTTFEIEGKTFHTINTHLAWGNDPFDRDYKIEQAQTLIDYIKKIPYPWIVSGDFNVIAGTRVIKSFDTLGRNLTTENNIQNTLNPNTHYVRSLFPKGLAVDYIYVSKDLEVKDFALIDKPDLSDHLGLSLEFSL